MIFLYLRRGDLSLQVDRVDNVYWLFGLEGLGRVKPDLTVASRLWPGGDRTGTSAGAKAGIVAQGTPHPPEVEAAAEGAAHRGTTGSRAHTPSYPLMVRDLREVFWLGRSSPPSRLQVDLTWSSSATPGIRAHKELICALRHSIDILEFLGEIGRTRIVIRSDNEPGIKGACPGGGDAQSRTRR